jgi:hypothetical protein
MIKVVHGNTEGAYRPRYRVITDDPLCGGEAGRFVYKDGRGLIYLHLDSGDVRPFHRDDLMEIRVRGQRPGRIA